MAWRLMISIRYNFKVSVDNFNLTSNAVIRTIFFYFSEIFKTDWASPFDEQCPRHKSFCPFCKCLGYGTFFGIFLSAAIQIRNCLKYRTSSNLFSEMFLHPGIELFWSGGASWQWTTQLKHVVEILSTS